MGVLREVAVLALEELPELLREAAELLRSRGPVLEAKAGRVLVVGDTHGYPEVSEWALSLADKAGADLVVFLGDYVDRGTRGSENLELLVRRLLDEPDRIVLLRGNHESPLMNLYYGFRDEVVSKLGIDILEPLYDFYTSLPYMLLADGILYVHGGVPCRVCGNEPEEPISLAEIRERLEELHGSRRGLDPEDHVAMQLLWNDPRGTIDWFLPSARGPGIYYYGREAWKTFMEANSLSLIVRGHESLDAFHVWLPDGSQRYRIDHGAVMNPEELRYSVVTVFSSLYHGAGAGAALVTEEGMVFLRYPEELPG
ncbi:hypothetical protein Pdsh_08170 [Pyrodictium delaneyi]|uniref:Serine/threonine specific protein phosphatases domain-containing protein n=1 Tax=Pyrodictium delaneyi TaxID=1273541 RepID=A0A211YN02_9CREN|nr:hypothetical protein Pdsh_08170 [Pyrodictium delaneyi]